jgi:hypothetical protein
MTQQPVRCLAIILFVRACELFAQPASTAATINGEWHFMRQLEFGGPRHEVLRLTLDGEKVTGTSGPAKIEGTFRAGKLEADILRGETRAGRLSGNVAAVFQGTTRAVRGAAPSFP